MSPFRPSPVSSDFGGLSSFMLCLSSDGRTRRTVRVGTQYGNSQGPQFSLKEITFMYLVCVCGVCGVLGAGAHNAHVEARGQLEGVGPLLLCGSWGINLGHQAWRQERLRSEPLTRLHS